MAPSFIRNITENSNKAKEATIQHSDNPKSARDAEKALVEFKIIISSILNLEETELKKLCQDKKIRIYGKAAMKHKYACALLEHCVAEKK